MSREGLKTNLMQAMNGLLALRIQVLHFVRFSESKSELVRRSGQQHADHLVPSPEQFSCIEGLVYCGG